MIAKIITIAYCLICFWAMPTFAGGFILVAPKGSDWQPGVRIYPPRPIPPPPPDFQPFPLELRSETATATLTDRIALTEIAQTFYNPTHSRIEGFFWLPLPKDANIDHFSMVINGKETPAELLDAQKARQIYEDIVRNLRDPALLEYSQQQVLKCRIFPIEPNSETHIKISYRQLLPLEDATVAYSYPLYTQKHAANPIQNIDLTLNLKTTEKIKNLYCPTHQADINRKNDNEAQVRFSQKQLPPTSDFQLYYTTDSKNDISASMLTYQNAVNEDGFFLLTLSPSIEATPKDIVSKDITFVLDVSGSMAGDKMDKAKEALLFCINNLNEGDCFNIIRFSTEARALFGEPQEANRQNLDQAKTFIADLKAIGGTNIDEALTLALQPTPRKDRPYVVVFMTDGKPTVGTTDEAQLLQKIQSGNPKNIRIFTVGIGEDLNTHLLDKITEYTQAYRTYIAPKEDIEVKISNFYTKINSPILTDIQLNFDRDVEVMQVYPKKLPDLFKGSSLTVIGKYKGNSQNKPLQLTLLGNANSEHKKFSYSLAISDKVHTEHGFIPTLWASRAVGYMLDQIRLNGESRELVDEVTRLARQYGIITPYTSYLIMEDEAITRLPPPQRHPIDPIDPIPMPRPNVYQKSRGTTSPSAEYSNMQRKDGEGSVRASSEIQALNKAENLDQTRQGQSRMASDTDEGKAQYIANEYRQLNGKTFYRSGKSQWVDSRAENIATATPKRIAFNSDAYFDLLQKQPELSAFLALGKQVIVEWQGKLYEIYE